MTGAVSVTGTRAVLGEGVRWDARRDELLWVDISDGRLFRERVTAGGRLEQVRAYHVGTALAAVAPVEGDDGFVVAAGRGFGYLAEDGSYTPLAEPAPDGVRMNDGACDPQGRFWAGTMGVLGQERAGVLYRLDRDGRVEVMREGLGMSNGVCWSADAATMYLVDSGPRRVYAFDLREGGGGLPEPRTLVELDEADGTPDGMTIDTDGCLWVALYGAGRVRRYSSQGRPLDEVRVPAEQTTCCWFGPPDGRRLYVTTATQGWDAARRDREPLAGGVFAAAVGAAGMPAAPYRPAGALAARGRDR